MNKLGIVGAGKWGSTIATRIHETGIANISIVYDKDIERARLLAQKVGAAVARDLGDFDKHKDLLGIIVATSIDSLAHVSAELIKMGFNVLIEKPVADSLDKVRMLRNLAESRRVVAMPGFVVRFDPISIWIKDRLSKVEESPEDLYLLRLSRRPPWAKVNSILLDLAIHDIDLARYLIESDIAPISWSIHNLEIDQAFTMYAKHRGGSVFINVDGVSKNKVRKVIISLTKSYIEGDYVNQYIISKSEGNEYEHLKIKGTEALVREITAFIDKCRGADVIEAPTLLDAEKAHEIINHVLSRKNHI